MIIHLRERGFESDSESSPVIVLDMFADGKLVSGPCGLHVEYPQLQEFIAKIDPDSWNDETYIPGRPIALKHIRIVES
jgi:hypothetical protein